MCLELLFNPTSNSKSIHEKSNILVVVIAIVVVFVVVVGIVDVVFVDRVVVVAVVVVAVHVGAAEDVVGTATSNQVILMGTN